MIQHTTLSRFSASHPDDPQASPEQQHIRSPQLAAQRRSALVSLVAGFAVPLGVYYLVRSHVGSDTIALAISGALPVAWTLVRLVWQRRLDPIGLIAVLGFAVELCIAVLTGGNAFALKLQEAPLTGLFGLACLVSVAIGRPLLPVVLRLLGRSASQVTLRQATRATLVVGATFFLDALTRVVLAASLPTTTFLAVSREVNWAIFGLGILVLLQLRRFGKH
jgi:hypothetical protein